MRIFFGSPCVESTNLGWILYPRKLLRSPILVGYQYAYYFLMHLIAIHNILYICIVIVIVMMFMLRAPSFSLAPGPQNLWTGPRCELLVLNSMTTWTRLLTLVQVGDWRKYALEAIIKLLFIFPYIMINVYYSCQNCINRKLGTCVNT